MLLILTGLSQTSFGYEDEKKDESCKKPKFTNFSLAEYKATDKKEVAPETDISFDISVWANPETLTITAKNKPLPFTVESNTSFHKVKLKLPAEFTGQFVRIQTGVKAFLGCSEHGGWLIKVAEKKELSNSQSDNTAVESIEPLAIPDNTTSH